MATVGELNFEAFVRERRGERPGVENDDEHAYAYSWDRTTRAAFRKARPIELAIATVIRSYKEIGKAALLANAVRVGPRQFPRVHQLTVKSATTLGIAPPTVYVVNNPHLNAMTYGTNDDSVVLLHSALVDHMEDDELLMVIGHECGHIHNNHVVYLTTLYLLKNVVGAFVRAVAMPAEVALLAWSRRAEITCDRAGALCTGDLDAATRAMTKLALGSRKLYDQLDIDVFLEQHAEAQQSIGRFGEALSTHPWLSKRVLALRAFAESELYRKHVGDGADGLTMQSVDEKVHEIIKVVG